MPFDVLLVDDHKIMRDGIKAILGRDPEFRVVGEADTGSGALPPEVAEVIYEAASRAVLAAAGRADVTSIRVSATGARSIAVRIADNGKPRPDSSLAMAAMLARHAGLSFETATGKGTIVSIRYALRRTSGG